MTGSTYEDEAKRRRTSGGGLFGEDRVQSLEMMEKGSVGVTRSRAPRYSMDGRRKTVSKLK